MSSEIDSLDPAVINPMEAIMALCERLGLTGLAQKFVGKCWEHQVDAQWWLALNPNRHDVESTHGTVPGFHVLVMFNGWPAAVFSVGGRGTFAQGTAANETTFNAAVLAAAKRLS